MPSPFPVFQRVSQTADLLGESPFWHPVEQCLYWVDIAGQALCRQRPGADDERWQLPAEPGCAAPAARGGVLLALRSGVILFDTSTGHITPLAPAPYDTATMRFNDGRCDPRGRFWAGTVYEPKTAPLAALFCLVPASDGCWTMERRLGDNITANGLAFSADGRRAWWTNTPEHVIRSYALDPDSGCFGAAEVFQRFAPRAAGAPYGGRPDGATIDSAGNYWVAMYEGGRVLQFSAAGDLLLEVAVPVTCPTMVCLGGPDLRTLFVTSARKGRPPAELANEALAGHVLAIELDALGVPPEVRGLPTAQWVAGG